MSITIVKEVHQVTVHCPTSELFGLTSQMRRAALSVPCNIAEGAARRGRAQLRQFVSIARGSLAELDTQVEVATQLGLLNGSEGLCKALHKVSLLVKRLYSSLAPKAQSPASYPKSQ
jgi:four helix bundle protein